MAKKKVEQILRCGKCGHGWLTPRRKYYESNCPFCEANRMRVALSVLNKNYDFGKEIRYCTRCTKILERNPADESHCTNCGNPEFGFCNLDILMQDCWHEPIEESSEESSG